MRHKSFCFSNGRDWIHGRETLARRISTCILKLLAFEMSSVTRKSADDGMFSGVLWTHILTSNAASSLPQLTSTSDRLPTVALFPRASPHGVLSTIQRAAPLHWTCGTAPKPSQYLYHWRRLIESLSSARRVVFSNAAFTLGGWLIIVFRGATFALADSAKACPMPTPRMAPNAQPSLLDDNEVSVILEMRRSQRSYPLKFLCTFPS